MATNSALIGRHRNWFFLGKAEGSSDIVAEPFGGWRHAAEVAWSWPMLLNASETIVRCAQKGRF